MHKETIGSVQDTRSEPALLRNEIKCIMFCHFYVTEGFDKRIY